jgi:hypothetical protein
MNTATAASIRPIRIATVTTSFLEPLCSAWPGTFGATGGTTGVEPSAGGERVGSGSGAGSTRPDVADKGVGSGEEAVTGSGLVSGSGSRLSLGTGGALGTDKSGDGLGVGLGLGSPADGLGLGVGVLSSGIVGVGGVTSCSTGAAGAGEKSSVLGVFVASLLLLKSFVGSIVTPVQGVPPHEMFLFSEIFTIGIIVAQASLVDVCGSIVKE